MKLRHLISSVVFFQVCAMPLHAAHWDLYYRLCPGEIVDFPPLVDRIRVPVGCELIDCCPGCPAAEVIDWRIRFEGPELAGVALRFDGLGREQARRLDIDGGRLVGDDRIQIDKPAALIRGLPADRVPTASIVPLVDKQAVDRLQTTADRDEQTFDRVATNPRGIVIEQMLGNYLVNSFRVRYALRWCRRPLPGSDQIKLKNNTGSDSAVVLVDSRTNAGCQNDRLFRTTSSVGIGNALTNGECSSEVAVFSDDNAMAFDTPVTSWTDSTGDAHTIDLQQMVTAPISVWLARPDALSIATSDLANANLLYNRNNAGIRFTPTYNDVSADAAAISDIGVDCGDAASAQASAFYTANALNIYYTNGAFTGVNCGLDRNINYIGTTANIASASHEIGHAYGLRPSALGGHTNGMSGFGNNNIMWGGGPGTRDQFTVGQAFRLNVDTGSMVNSNGNRVGPTRPCAPDVSTAACPALDLDALPD
jgi:hypothetical protein